MFTLAHSDADLFCVVSDIDYGHRIQTSRFHFLDQRSFLERPLLCPTDKHGGHDVGPVADHDRRSPTAFDGSFHAYFHGLDISKFALRATALLVFI